MLNGRLLLIVFLANVKCDGENDSIDDYTMNSLNQYNGHKFPTKYLKPEEPAPNIADLKQYVKSLRRTVYYFNKTPNNTDGNIAVGAFYTKSILKRMKRDYGTKLPGQELIKIADIINKCENIVSHYIYINYQYGWDDIEFRVSRILKDDDVQVYSIGAFNTGRLNRWILSNTAMHEYVEDMDTISLPRDKYAQLTEEGTWYYIGANASDACISRVAYEPEPIVFSNLRKCHFDVYCYKRLHSSPSISYYLTHRLLNLIMRRQIRRCYLKSAVEDDSLIESLCASMYREAVYLARRGFFARDLFLEHITLCGMLGYVEFHRRNWFNKAMSWMNKRGCIKESRNYNYNITRLFIQRVGENSKQAKLMRKQLRRELEGECDTHPMALLLVVLAHGIRYAAHHLPSPTRAD